MREFLKVSASLSEFLKVAYFSEINFKIDLDLSTITLVDEVLNKKFQRDLEALRPF